MIGDCTPRSCSHWIASSSLAAETTIDAEVSAVQLAIFRVVILAAIRFPARVLAVVWVAAVQALHAVAARVVHAAGRIVLRQASVILCERQHTHCRSLSCHRDGSMEEWGSMSFVESLRLRRPCETLIPGVVHLPADQTWAAWLRVITIAVVISTQARAVLLRN